MIRVNLLQNRLPSSGRVNLSQSVGTNLEATSAQLSMSAARSALITRLVFLALAPVGLIIYEQMNLSVLRTQAAAAEAEVQNLQQQVTEKEQIVAQSADLKEKAKELADKIGILKKLARTRLREIKALDFIQTKMPEKLWLKDISFKSGAVMIHGSAVTDDDLNIFVRALEKNRSFSNVLLLQAKEERSREGSVKVFEISCNLEAE